MILLAALRTTCALHRSGHLQALSSLSCAKQIEVEKRHLRAAGRRIGLPVPEL
jgi:hypothetical protein